MQKKTIIGIACAVVLLIVASIFYAYKGNPLPSIIDLKQATKDSSLKKYNIVLPKSKATPAYYASYNAAVNDFIILENAYRDDVAPLLARAQAYLAKKDYSGLSSLATKAGNINDVQKKRLMILSADFDSFSAVNEATVDRETKSLTAEFIKAGKNMVEKYTAYSALIDDILSGNLSSQSESQAKAVVSGFTTATDSFRTATKKLTTYFSDVLVTDLKDYFASSTKTR